MSEDGKLDKCSGKSDGHWGRPIPRTMGGGAVGRQPSAQAVELKNSHGGSKLELQDSHYRETRDHAGCDSPPVSNIEDSSVVLLPGEKTLDFLRNVRLASCWQSHHDNDQL